jgi:hypothetical protein
MSKQLVLALAAGTTAFAAVVGSAATLGGITSDDLGANTQVVASCDEDGIAVDYTTAYDATAGVYEVSKVTLTGIDAGCNGQAVRVTLGGEDGDPSLAEATGTVVVAAADPLAVPVVVLDDTHELTITGGVDAESVENIAVVISG